MKKNLIFIANAIIFLAVLFVADRLLDHLMLGGINRYYGLNGDADIVIIGPSQIMLGIDKVQLEKKTGMKVAKYTREGVNLADRYEMLKHYFSTCQSSPKIVILNVDKYLFTSQGLSQNSYRLFFPFMSTASMNQYIKKNASSKEYWFREVFYTLRYDEFLLNHAIRGYCGRWDNLKRGKVNIDELEQNIQHGKYKPRKIAIEEKEIQSFHNMIQFLNKQNVAVILLDIPYAKPVEEYYPMETEIVRKYFKDAEISNKKIYYLRLNHLCSHGEWYADENHLNPAGQQSATETLAKYIQTNSVLLQLK